MSRYRYLATSMLILVATVALGQESSAHTVNSSTVNVSSTSSVVFTSEGILTGQPPTLVRPGEKLSFVVTKDRKTTTAQIAEVAGTLVDAIEGLKETIDKRQTPSFLSLGIDVGQLGTLRDSYCRTTSNLASQLDATSNRDSLLQRLAEACPGDKVEISGSIPPFEFGTASYVLRTSCRDTASEPQESFTVNVPNEKCNELRYELRLAKPLAKAIEAWTATHAVSPELRAVTAKAREKWTQESVDRHGELDKYKKLRDCLETAKSEVPEIVKCTDKTDHEEAYQALLEADDALAAATAKMETLFADILKAGASDFAKQWLWLTGGRPTLHPLVNDDLAVLRDKLKTRKEELAILDAQVATFEKLTGAGVKIDDAAKLTDVVKNLGQVRADRDKAAADVDKMTKDIANAAKTRLRDTFLYDGLLLVSDGSIHMQHHDALNRYVIMGTPIREIREDQRVAILAENAATSADLKVAQTVTPITHDTSRFTEELALTQQQAAAVVLPPHQSDQAIRLAAGQVKTDYDFLKRGVAFADAELKEPPINIRYEEDDAPAHVTKLLPHDIPPAPATVSYKITEKVGSDDKEVGGATYRENRLYRSRFKTGLLYSLLESTKIDTANNNAEKITKHGVDALFGLQTYIGPRRDPRTSGPAWSVLTALTLRNPTENLLVGAGYEPYGGVTLNFGGHVGRTEKLHSDPGHPNVNEQWKVEPFFGVSFDVDFLKQLFTLKPSV